MNSDVPAKIIAKIKKCLDLSTSANPHEAAAALRQANKLMAMHGVSLERIQDSRVSECKRKAGQAGRSNVAFWKRRLAACAAKALGCQLLYQWNGKGKYIVFVGQEGMPEMARYAYDVLVRQLEVARKSNAETIPEKLGKGEKRRLTNVYTLGWTEAVVEKVKDFAGPSAESAKQTADYIKKRHGELDPVQAAKPKRLEESEVSYLQRGYADGQSATLYRPVQTSSTPDIGLPGGDCHRRLV